MTRVIVWFSCGAASAVTAKLAVEKYPKALLVNNDTLASEHPDNEGFLQDVENWVGHGKKVIRLQSEKYLTVDDVFLHRKFMSSPHGAPCTLEMKKIPRFKFQRPGDLHLFGLCADEADRISGFERDNPDLDMEWILRDRNLRKSDCLRMVEEAGIPLPEMYRLGFKNNNCIGCVKATSPAYWNKVREHFPRHFSRRVWQSRMLGAKLVRYKGERIFLGDLPILNNDPTPEEDIECGPLCVNQARFDFEAEVNNGASSPVEVQDPKGEV